MVAHSPEGTIKVTRFHNRSRFEMISRKFVSKFNSNRCVLSGGYKLCEYTFIKIRRYWLWCWRFLSSKKAYALTIIEIEFGISSKLLINGFVRRRSVRVVRHHHGQVIAIAKQLHHNPQRVWCQCANRQRVAKRRHMASAPASIASWLTTNFTTHNNSSELVRWTVASNHRQSQTTAHGLGHCIHKFFSYNCVMY